MQTECITVDGQGVLVATPIEPVVVGPERLAAMRRDLAASIVDNAILRSVRREAGRVSVIVIRGEADDGTSTWRFSDDLDPGDYEELGTLMVRSQLALYRELAAEGVVLSLKVGWGPREADALQAGSLAALCALSASGQLTQLDEWLLAHFSFWLLASYASCRDNFLPRNLPRFMARRATLGRLIHDYRAAV
ncbi:MAG: hypothetical protein AB8I08_17275 [Sandaracinaceae bacterium]